MMGPSTGTECFLKGSKEMNTVRSGHLAGRIAACMMAVALLALPMSCDDGSKTGGGGKLTFEEFHAKIIEAGIWTGGPAGKFEQAGRGSLAAAIAHGLNPDHKLLDIGAGCMRIGWWLIQYIEPRNYHAVEPNKEMIDTAVNIIGEEVNVYFNEDWVFPDVDFDMVFARSIWTHASKSMISKMLEEFAKVRNPSVRFLTSVQLAETEEEDYKGEEWVGISHDSDTPGLVKHSLEWIESECKKNKLVVEVKEEFASQTWLLITQHKRKHR